VIGRNLPVAVVGPDHGRKFWTLSLSTTTIWSVHRYVIPRLDNRYPLDIPCILIDFSSLYYLLRLTFQT
jgi:hypothetical protein